MKLAFFHPTSGLPTRIFSGSSHAGDLVRTDARFRHHVVRELDGTAFQTTMCLAALPVLLEFDAVVAMTAAEEVHNGPLI